jgi:hypothetical protein
VLRLGDANPDDGLDDVFGFEARVYLAALVEGLDGAHYLSMVAGARNRQYRLLST